MHPASGAALTAATQLPGCMLAKSSEYYQSHRGLLKACYIRVDKGSWPDCDLSTLIIFEFLPSRLCVREIWQAFPQFRPGSSSLGASGQ